MSDDGCYSQWRSANKYGSNSVRQRIGFIRDNEASRRYTGSSHWENSAKISGQKPHLIKNGRKIECNTANYVSFVVPGLSTSSSTSSSPASPTSSSQESVTTTEHPASTRSENMSDEVQGNLSHGPAETENPNKNDDNEEVQGNLSHALPEWPQEFRHGLVGGSVPEYRDASSSSQELPSEPLRKVVSGNHSTFTSRSTETATFARKPRTQGVLAEHALVQPYFEQKIWVI